MSQRLLAGRWRDRHPRRDGSGTPYNADGWLTTPTPDGSGSVIHPSVVDMGRRGWNGFRFWMAVTPYYLWNDALENPCVLASHDGLTWVVPPGVTNPLHPAPAESINSDTDIVYDPEGDRLIVIWRWTPPVGDGTFYNRVLARTSTDGATWTPTQTIYELISPSILDFLSPSLVRAGPSDWRLFGTKSVVQSTSPLGPWTNSQQFTWSGSSHQLWHATVTYHGGEFRMLGNHREPWGLHAAVSANGVAWTHGPEILGVGEVGAWDRDYIYRAGWTPCDDRGVYRVWYSGYSAADSWRIGYTELPMSNWANL